MSNAPTREPGVDALFRKVRERQIGEIFEQFRSCNIEPILIKGWGAERYYPLGKDRPFSDVDLAVSPLDHPLALDFVKQLTGTRLPVDLHRGLRHLDTVAWEDLFANSELIGSGSTAIRVLRPEDHLRVLCVHWLNDGGSNRGRLSDVYYLISNRPESFDWVRCLEVVSPRRRRWIICTIGLAHKYLGLDLACIPFEEEAKRIPAWVIACIEREWERGGQILPILSAIGRPGAFWDQVRRRLPPNPLRAMVEGEGDIDRRILFDYQVRVLIRRAIPFLNAVPRYIYGRLSHTWDQTPNRE